MAGRHDGGRGGFPPDDTWGELHVGARKVFEEAGFVEMSRPTLRRVVMHIDLETG